jgi:L-ascorbate metabolism protein UlaG (beta-lactamase superfamily)
MSTGRLAITWLGHSAFQLRTPGGKTLLLDPWYSGNPKFPGQKPTAADLILCSHGHSDHITDAAAMAKATGATVVGIFELVSWLGAKGVQHLEPMNKGGTITVQGLRITMTEALHSSSFDENGTIYLGEPAGFVIRLENGQTIYFAGDTALFSDMKLLGELYAPDIAFLPIGDRFTMGPDTAATAAKWLGVKQVVPMHWGTFPLLTGTPAQLKEHLAGTGIEILELEPGQTAE